MQAYTLDMDSELCEFVLSFFSPTISPVQKFQLNMTVLDPLGSFSFVHMLGQQHCGYYMHLVYNIFCVYHSYPLGLNLGLHLSGQLQKQPF